VEGRGPGGAEADDAKQLRDDDDGIPSLLRAAAVEEDDLVSLAGAAIAMASAGKGSTNGGDGARSLGTSGKRTRGGPVASWRRLSIAPDLEDPAGIAFFPSVLQETAAGGFP
jgi:hypothetical protein